MRYRALSWIGLFLVGGCSDGLVAVRGTVNLDGKPVDDGSVNFQPADGNGPTAGGTVKDGQFELPTKLPPGTYKVSVRGAVKTGRKLQAGPPLPPGSTVDEVIMYPPSGQNPELATVEVKPGGPPLTFELTMPKAAKK